MDQKMQRRRERLLEKAKHGDKEALGRLMIALQPSLQRRLEWRHDAKSHDAEDCVMAAFEKILKDTPAFQTPWDVYAYAARLSTSTYIDEFHKRRAFKRDERRTQQLPDNLPYLRVDDPAQFAEARDLEMHIKKSLTSDQQPIFEAMLEGQQPKDIYEHMHEDGVLDKYGHPIRQRTVQRRVHDIQETAKKILGDRDKAPLRRFMKDDPEVGGPKPKGSRGR